jgi:phospholipid/cholesterol/gamma-HCH transport system substrate-binding protein
LSTEEGMGESGSRMSWVGRVAAVGAIIIALAAVGYLMLGGGGSYEVRARFQAATQMVKGNLVQVGGRKVGLVKEIKLTRDGQAELIMEIDDPDYTPLRNGTQATIRVASLSGIVNRYVDLRIPSGQGGGTLADGGLIPQSDTTSAVDLDQLFNLFDKRTRKGLQDFIRGQSRLYQGEGDLQNAGWRYLNPSLVATTRLFNELNRDSKVLSDFLVSNSKLVTDLAERDTDLTALVDRLATTTGAIAREETNLSSAISELPPFMRRANSTFVNLRSTLDDLDPLVEESKPVTPKLRRVLAELRPFARDATPTIRDLADLSKSPGKDDDLIDLAKAVPPFRDIAIGPVQRNGKERPGSFATSTESLRRQRTPFAFFRPYLVDFTGWLDDFSHSGIYDAYGSASRVATSVNAFATVGGSLKLVPQQLRDELSKGVARSGQINRCPGSTERPAEDGSNPWKPAEFDADDCDPSQIPPGN